MTCKFFCATYAFYWNLVAVNCTPHETLQTFTIETFDRSALLVEGLGGKKRIGFPLIKWSNMKLTCSKNLIIWMGLNVRVYFQRNSGRFIADPIFLQLCILLKHSAIWKSDTLSKESGWFGGIQLIWAQAYKSLSMLNIVSNNAEREHRRCRYCNLAFQCIHLDTVLVIQRYQHPHTHFYIREAITLCVIPQALPALICGIRRV